MAGDDDCGRAGVTLPEAGGGVADDRPIALLGWLRLARVYQKIDHATAELLRRWELSVAQFDVLTQLGVQEGITQQQLADRLLVTKGNVSQLIVKMERRGLIRRSQEGRSMRLSLTTAGRRLRDATVPAQEALIAGHFAHLGTDDLRTLHALLRRVDRGADRVEPLGTP